MAPFDLPRIWFIRLFFSTETVFFSYNISARTVFFSQFQRGAYGSRNSADLRFQSFPQLKARHRRLWQIWPKTLCLPWTVEVVRSQAESLPTGWLIIPAIPTRKGLGLGVSPLLEKRNEMIRSVDVTGREKHPAPRCHGTHQLWAIGWPWLWPLRIPVGCGKFASPYPADLYSY